MEVYFIPGPLPDKFQKPLYELLCQCAGEFYPPLNDRKGVMDTMLQSGLHTSDGPQSYFQAMIQQEHILIYEKDILVAFLSFQKHYRWQNCPQTGFYISTLAVDKRFRGQGLLHKLYDALDTRAVQKDVPFIVTRTWSTNYAQFTTLKKHQYEILHTIENDRGAGVGTVYFIKRLKV